MRTLPQPRLLLVLPLLAILGACTTPQNPDQIRERTANATATVKSDTKAIAEGIKEGLGKSTNVDINSANKEELMKLPGITEARAERIMADRPYDKASDLLTKKVLTRGEYDQIASRITVKK